MKVQLKINNEVMKMLNDWRSERLTYYQNELAMITDESLKKAIAANSRVIEQADYGYLAQLYLSYMEVERR